MHLSGHTSTSLWPMFHIHTSRLELYVLHSHILVSSLMFDFQICFSSRFMQVRAMSVLCQTLPMLPPASQIDRWVDHFNLSICHLDCWGWWWVDGLEDLGFGRRFYKFIILCCEIYSVFRVPKIIIIIITLVTCKLPLWISQRTVATFYKCDGQSYHRLFPFFRILHTENY